MTSSDTDAMSDQDYFTYVHSGQYDIDQEAGQALRCPICPGVVVVGVPAEV